MSSYAMDHKYGRCTRQREQLAGNLNIANLWVFLKKSIIPLALVGYEILTANSYPTRTCEKSFKSPSSIIQVSALTAEEEYLLLR